MSTTHHNLNATNERYTVGVLKPPTPKPISITLHTDLDSITHDSFYADFLRAIKENMKTSTHRFYGANVFSANIDKALKRASKKDCVQVQIHPRYYADFNRKLHGADPDHVFGINVWGWKEA